MAAANVTRGRSRHSGRRRRTSPLPPSGVCAIYPRVRQVARRSLPSAYPGSGRLQRSESSRYSEAEGTCRHLIRDILAPMNYRRGFQRAYAVLVGLWLALLLTTFSQKQMWTGAYEDTRLVGILVIPPAVGYFILFALIPWIYRGFRPNR
jgi:hypothetical protein